MFLGLDADTILTPFAAKMAAAQILRAGRYLKNLTKSEVGALHAEKIGVWLIAEVNAEDAIGGEASGREKGLRALDQATALGAPATAAIYATADTDITPDQLTVAEEYWAAFDAVIFGHYQIGGYADGTALSGLRDHGLPYCWLAGAMGWDGSKEFLASGNPTMVQGPTLSRGGVWAPHGMAPIQWPSLGFSYDPNIILGEDCGAWLPA